MSSFKALFLSAYADSFCEGMRDGYRQGLWDKGKGLQRLRNKEIDGILKRKKQKNDISRER
ncbi:MAG: hypothetical protein COB85_09680 [Bacteroidetes bacterium]|nr:MAG: hypothetical protein COB85_09680 [Bacteroidota bacterium]